MGVRSWWRGLSAAAKFRLYSRVILQVGLVVVIVAMAVTAGSWWSAGLIVAAGVAAIAVVEIQPDFAPAAAPPPRPWIVPAATAILTGLWLAAMVIARSADEDRTATQAGVAGIYIAILAMFSVISFARHRWWAVLGVSVATGIAFGSTPAVMAGFALMTFLCGGFVVGTTILTVWGLRVVEELDRAKAVESELRVAQERLRFARDLHDVVGRGFSAIAVKSELAAVLARAGAGERAAAEMDEVKSLAVESMGQMRQLVRGYRDIDLRGEVAGARSLLSAVGCELVVEGDPAKVPARLHEVAAWVVREGTTNIVEHSRASTAILALGRSGMSLRNDRPQGVPGERSGLRGLAERLAPVGATLTAELRDDRFVLEIQWEEM
ncbi:histidine kinase [Nocardia sp. NPDC005978]|uniref:sensor histidine kinase n=1 Tax=unclassified Nocardia TaxID=2637762 RepID=UPI0033B4DAE1